MVFGSEGLQKETRHVRKRRKGGAGHKQGDRKKSMNNLV